MPSILAINYIRMDWSRADMLSLEIRAEYPDERTARAVMDALAPENEGYV